MGAVFRTAAIHRRSTRMASQGTRLIGKRSQLKKRHGEMRNNLRTVWESRVWKTLLVLAVATCSLTARPPQGAPPSSSDGVVCADSSGGQPVELATDALERLIKTRSPLSLDRLHNSSLVGRVSAEVTVDKDGNVCSVKAIEGHPMAIAAAMKSLPSWKFRTYKLKGLPRAVHGVLRLDYDFRGTSRKQPAPKGEVRDETKVSRSASTTASP